MNPRMSNASRNTVSFNGAIDLVGGSLYACVQGPIPQWSRRRPPQSSKLSLVPFREQRPWVPKVLMTARFFYDLCASGEGRDSQHHRG